MNIIYFAHGKESGPWGTKILTLAEIAKEKDWAVECPDYTATFDPDERVKMLLDRSRTDWGKVVLVGSSMGGYVSTVASSTIRPAGLFLMAPAFYLHGYGNQDPEPCAEATVVVHGWRDEVVPAVNAIRFAEKHRAQLHMVDAGHQLLEQIPFLKKVFGWFLDGLK
jgi:alpha/beta superfamily hydrolase